FGATLRLMVLLGVLGQELPAIAQEPTDAVLGGVKYQILDLKYVIEDLGGRVEGLQVQETPSETRIALDADVLFDFDKADILPEAADTLKRAAAVIRDKGRGSVRIDGYTDAKGSDAYNQRLSTQRAEAVRNWLVDREGLRNMRFVTAGFGSQRPVAP